MAIITSTVKAGQGPGKEEWVRIKAELREAKRHPIVYDEDSPKLTPEARKEFAFLRAEKNRQKKRQTVSIRLAPDCIEAYKAIGKGYTGIMADILTYAAHNPDILARAIR
jgi:uncharacterized protein (DUF4415 family)